MIQHDLYNGQIVHTILFYPNMQLEGDPIVQTGETGRKTIWIIQKGYKL